LIFSFPLQNFKEQVACPSALGFSDGRSLWLFSKLPRLDGNTSKGIQAKLQYFQQRLDFPHSPG
jgi:hypothetical protein